MDSIIFKKYQLFCFFLVCSVANANAPVKFYANSSLDCSSSIFGGVDTCTQTITAVAYNLPKADGAVADVTCYSNWNYRVKDDNNIEKELVVTNQGVVNSQSVRIKLNITDSLKTIKQVQQPTINYTCDIKY